MRRIPNQIYLEALGAKRGGVKTAFLCHSHKDSALVENLLLFFNEKGLNLYIDWKDATLPEVPIQDTANKIQKRIQETDIFLYLATQNSSGSKWCPWEMGFGDAIKGKDKIFIIPTQEGTHKSGQEYLSLYQSLQIEGERFVRYDPRTNIYTTWNL